MDTSCWLWGIGCFLVMSFPAFVGSSFICLQKLITPSQDNWDKWDKTEMIAFPGIVFLWVAGFIWFVALIY